MLIAWGRLVWFALIFNFNTSHVNVNLDESAEEAEKWLFQYISC